MTREDQSAAARSAVQTRLERQVDADGKLPSAECAALVKAAARELSARLNAAKACKRRTAGDE
jgi:hypothetical protein